MDPLLHIKLRDRLADARGQWRAIAEASGISYSWLSQFARGIITNPGYVTLCKLRPALPRGRRRKG